ncbi:MAG: ATP-binding protein, partial [Prosthecobacter sp.]|uniref:ATP-binding protein n=1 Tax=Prosthecobacter sp. TaxID=1965333 RepID=UPI003BB1D6ED
MSKLNSGARWYRWEPHIHAPGTIFNDQFGGVDKFEDYLTKLEDASPPIRAIGVTDYYLTDSYEKVRSAKDSGRLPNCDLIFPNIELRLDIATQRGRQVNIHLLVSPEDPQHLTELTRFLGRLTFEAFSDTFDCTKEDLIRLGKRFDDTKTGMAILRTGAEQFKINLSQLRTAYNQSKWARENILIAVAGSETDGTSGVRDPADTILRQEIEAFAHIIFASSPAQREFWLGERSTSVAELKVRFGGLKPCMHGCDAHQMDTVGVPTADRYSWIKGSLEFDTLRQACIDPSGRAFVGPTVPLGASSSQVIASLKIQNAQWALTPELELNPGLVAIIGARGSGKTALADMIALACDAVVFPFAPASFLNRANEHLAGSTITITWGTGEKVKRNLDETSRNEVGEYARARYLSQQFVDELCSAEGMTDRLLEEIERVIFESHPVAETDGTT